MVQRAEKTSSQGVGYQTARSDLLSLTNQLYTFPGLDPILRAVSNFSFSAIYYYSFFGYNRWGPRSRVQ